MTGLEAALAVCRLLHDTATMLLWGAFGLLATLVPRDLALATARRLQAFRVAAIAVAVVTTAAALPLTVAAIGSGWGDALDPDTVEAVLFETNAGGAWQVQGLAALLLVATLAVPSGRQIAFTAVAAGLLLATLALTGHAAMDEGWLGLGHRLDDAAHVLAGGAWLGALVPLLLVLTALDDPRQRRQAATALHRFSSVGHAVVALVLATGALNTLLVLRRWPAPSSPYQALLLGKIAIVTLMTGLAVLNRYWFVPRMASDHDRSVRAVRLATIAEIGLGVAAIGCVGLFGLLDPN